MGDIIDLDDFRRQSDQIAKGFWLREQIIEIKKENLELKKKIAELESKYRQTLTLVESFCP